MMRANFFPTIARARWFVPLCLLLLALAARGGLLLLHSFDGLYGQDAYAYYQYARELRAALLHLQFPPPFWWSLGYPSLLNAGFALGGVNITAAQMITLLCGALAAPFAFALAYEAAPVQKTAAGWVAGLLCAFGGQLVQSSVVVMTDAPALMFATLGGWLLLRYVRTRVLATLLLSSLAAGFAVWMRWQNLIFAGAWIAALALAEWQAARISIRGIARISMAIVIIALVLSPQFFVSYNTGAPLAGSSWLDGWSPVNFLGRTFDNVDGHFEYGLPVALFYGQVVAHPAYLFVMLTPLFITGAAALVKRIRTRLPAVVLLLGWIAGMYLFLAGIPYENFRFPLGFFAPLAAVTGIGAGIVWAHWGSRRAHAFAAGWIAAALLVTVAWQPRVLAPVWESKAQQLAHARWLEKQALPNALVYTMGIDGALQEYSNLRVANLWDLDPAKLNPETPTYLYADTNNIDTQWRGRLPDQLVRVLTETNFLHPLDSFDGWTLFRVRDCKYRVMDCE